MNTFLQRFVSEPVESRASRHVFWAAVWLAVAFVATKTYHLGRPAAAIAADYGRSLSAISYADVAFAVAFWALGATLLLALRRRPSSSRRLAAVLIGVGAICCFYSVANVVIFEVFGGFLTYPLLALLGDVRMVRSSVGSHVTAGTLTALLGIPLAYATVVVLSSRIPGRVAQSRAVRVAAALAATAWIALGQIQFNGIWHLRADRRIAANSEWVFASSWWHAVLTETVVRMPEQFPPSDLDDFEPIGSPASGLPRALRQASAMLDERVSAARRPPNVILIVLESVGARWTTLDNPAYETTPTLVSESAHAAVFPNAYAHIGRSSNSLTSILLSIYPKLDFREITEQFPHLPGTSIATLFKDRGYRTAFMTPSDLSWAGWREFLSGRGFSEINDDHDLTWCPDMVSSWGVEDRCMVDAMVKFVGETHDRPFFLMGWTTQTHHPYEMTPGVPELNLLKESTPDDWELGHYLNIIHETDHQLARIFAAVRENHLDDNTIIVITGDHGQAFGYPHANTYVQGRTVYQEDVNVPLMFWYPRAYKASVRPQTIARHVDIAPTIMDLAGIRAGADWQGRSLVNARDSRRAYFYVAESTFTLGVREDNWKYIYDLRDGTEELYDLSRDPSEQQNVAANEPARCARLRQRLAAWTEANRRQYDRITVQAKAVIPTAPATP